jgi:CheY-like chemotaxis protein
MPNESAAAVGLLLSDDLLFASRITSTGQALRLPIKSARNSELLKKLVEQEKPRCLLIDLSNPGLEIAALIADVRTSCSPTPRIVAYGSHVDTETLRKAREAGCDIVLPRSKFVEQLPTDLTKWCSE